MSGFAARADWIVAALVAIALATGCGRDEAPAGNPPAARESTPSATSPSEADGPPEVSRTAATTQEIDAAASSLGIPQPVAKALFETIARAGLQGEARMERLGDLAIVYQELLSSQPASGLPDQSELRAGDFAGASQATERALSQLTAAASGSESSDVTAALEAAALQARLGTIGLLAGQDARSEQAFQAALEALPADAYIQQAQVLGRLGMAQLSQGRTADAQISFEKSVRLHKSHQGNQHPEVAAGFSRLADCYRAGGDYAKAEILYRRALDIRQQTTPLEPRELARAKSRLAAVYRLQGKEAEAQALMPGGERA